jgi:hypothetical protein
MGGSASLTGSDPTELCTCIYDNVEQSGASFADFNDLWVAEDVQTETGNPAFGDFNSAIFDCAA